MLRCIMSDEDATASCADAPISIIELSLPDECAALPPETVFKIGSIHSDLSYFSYELTSTRTYPYIYWQVIANLS